MGHPVPAVDLSNGKYDEFETMLSERLEIKTILVRDWEVPASYHMAEAMISFAHTQGELDKARADFSVVEDTVMGSLRANIVDRDPEIGHSLTDNDLRSLLEVWHVTKRGGNAEPERAVIIFDPASRRDRSWPLNFALKTYCENAWDSSPTDNKYLPQVKDLIENFQMEAEDVRRYLAIKNVRYALQNQSEYNNLGRGWYYAPAFYKFAGIAGEDSGGMNASTFDMPYEQVVKKLTFDVVAAPEKWGMKDPEFLDNLRLAGAIMNLNYNVLQPRDTFARLGCRRDVNGKQINDIQKGLEERIEKQIEKHLPKGTDHFDMYDAKDDWRFLFPVFREIYEKDKSKGPEREYLDTIMAGLQKWFPTITNAPVPRLEAGHEPPRKLEKKPSQSPRQQPPKPAL